MTVRIAAAVLVLMVAACGGGGAEDQVVASPSAQPPAESGAASASFASPKADAKVDSPVALTMKAKNIAIEDSGVVRKGAGHFHVMIDTKCVAKGKVIPEDAKHVHYGDASTKAKLKLDPGKHKLCLQLGSGGHKALGKTDTVTITVK